MWKSIEKAKPVETRGRKTTDPLRKAGLPANEGNPAFCLGFRKIVSSCRMNWAVVHSQYHQYWWYEEGP
jgi:hypothetical protein